MKGFDFDSPDVTRTEKVRFRRARPARLGERIVQRRIGMVDSRQKLVGKYTETKSVPLAGRVGICTKLSIVGRSPVLARSFA
jgi:hypothetical protein